MAALPGHTDFLHCMHHAVSLAGGAAAELPAVTGRGGCECGAAAA